MLYLYSANKQWQVHVVGRGIFFRGGEEMVEGCVNIGPLWVQEGDMPPLVHSMGDKPAKMCELSVHVRK